MRLDVTGLAVRRGTETIFEGVGFSLGAGEGLLVTGPNGAGKSTLLRAIAGFIRPLAGSCRMSGAGEETDPSAHCHFLGPVNAMKPALSVRENLGFWRGLGGTPALTPAEALEKVDLPHVLDLPFAYLSTGQRRRVAIARLFVTKRPLWLVDEPTSGLDAQSEAVFARLLGDHLASGGIAIAATHLPIPVPGMKTLRFSRAPA